MKTIFTVLFTFLSLVTSAQEIPIDSASGKIVYTKVIEVVNESKTALYGNAKSWFAESFRSANDVIQNDDKENGIIQGKANSLIWDGMYRLYYDVKVMVKDGSYKYEFSNLYMKYIAPGQSLTGTDYSAEQMTLQNIYDKKGNPNKFVQRMRQETSVTMEDLVASLQSRMAKKSEDW